MRRAPAVLGGPGVLDAIGDLGPRLAGVLPRLTAAAEATGALPAGLNHADVTLTNILVGPGGVTGLIDFGDMHHTAHVCDLAVALTAVLRNTPGQQPIGTWELAAAVLAGYQRHRPLTPPEVEVIGDLVVARLGLTLAISHRLSTAYPDNRAYVGQYEAGARRVLPDLLDLGPGEVTRRLHLLAGTARTGGPGARGSAAAATGQDASGTLLERRRRVTGGPLSPLFYSRPLEIVRGEGPWLFAADGTRYLDAYNNVAVVGHAHPTVVQSVNRQNALLNTHSRYLHEGIVELAERLLATMPDGLDTILFTTSGTEANELAWRMATAYTGGNAAIIAEHAYHGSSKWTTDLSSNEWPPGYRPAHVGTFAAPRAGDGGTDRQTASGRVAAAAADLAAAGDKAALVLADPGFTSEGILNAPAEFLAGLVDGAHHAGALFLADEVQSGFGRVGPAFWRFAAGRHHPGFRGPRQADGRRLPHRRADHPPRDRRQPGPRLRVLLDLRRLARPPPPRASPSSTSWNRSPSPPRPPASANTCATACALWPRRTPASARSAAPASWLASTSWPAPRAPPTTPKPAPSPAPCSTR